MADLLDGWEEWPLTHNGIFVLGSQIVGVCTEELHAAQQWNGQGILELLRTVPV